MDHFDFCIAGAGVIGLATAYKLSAKYPDASILLIDKAERIGNETSSRNSEVIHAGIYYPRDSLKARLCVQGREALYEFCDQYKVPYRKIGKLIVATDQQDLPALEQLQIKARNNGVELDLWDEDRVKGAEPEVNGKAALHSPNTGILDSHSYMQTLLALAEQNGVLLSLNTCIENIDYNTAESEFNIRVQSTGQDFNFACRNLINCSGLHASELADLIDYPNNFQAPETHYCIGHYFSYQGKSPFNQLIYPLPSQNLQGLGVHATLDIAGQCRFGPDSEYIESIDYQFDESRKSEFAQAIRSYFPKLNEERLTPAYTGIRPKLSKAGDPAVDFTILSQQDHGIPGLIHCLGIESPGLTSSLSLADFIVNEKLGSA